MDRLSELEAFVAVAEAGGFTAAARSLGRTTSAVSKQVRALEERLGVRLLNRTTRRVAHLAIARRTWIRQNPHHLRVGQTASQRPTRQQRRDCCPHSSGRPRRARRGRERYTVYLPSVVYAHL